MRQQSEVIFDRNVAEFVTVSAEFCTFIERADTMARAPFVDTLLKLLPLLYIKAAMLPEVERMDDDLSENYVTEDIYEVVRINIAALLGEADGYMDVFLADMKYSDTPIARNISEDLSDIYQEIKDFVFVFRLGLNATMNDALYACKESFGLLWGQKLVNTMRALHELKYANLTTDTDDDYSHIY
jgi:hypothetical protein